MGRRSKRGGEGGGGGKQAKDIEYINTNRQLTSAPPQKPTTNLTPPLLHPSPALPPSKEAEKSEGGGRQGRTEKESKERERERKEGDREKERESEEERERE